MVSDMKEWCNQYMEVCPNCKNQGYYLIRNLEDPLGPEQIPKYCTCVFGRRLIEKNSISKPLPKESWDKIWMNLAKDISTRSTCKVPNRQVGCVIVSDDNTSVLAIGYNGSAKGDDNSCDYEGEKKFGDSRCTCVHAEMNALVKLDTPNPCKKKMYLTLSPCKLCYKLIVNAGINEVIYLDEYDQDINKRLQQLGARIRKYEDN